jgi:hypothetical protein
MMMHSPRFLTATPVAFLAILCLSQEPAEAQRAPEPIRLGAPAATFPQDFGAIQTVRELPDGRVLVADPLSKAVYLVDLAEGRRTVVGREGQGPGEYRQPDAVWPLPGDSTLLVDLGNGRLVTVGPDLSFGASVPIALGDPRPGQGMVMALPQGVDGQGRIYARAMGGPGGGPYPDSAAILRIHRGTRAVDTAATFKLQSVTQAVSGGAATSEVRISPIPLSPEDAWGVAPDGSVVVARSADYRVEWVAPDGSVSRGSPVPFTPVRIGNAEREEQLLEQGRSGGGIAIGVEMRNDQVSVTFSRGGAGARGRDAAQYSWPQAKPPFYSGRIPVDPLGRAWVRRHVRAGEPSTYDVFDRRGERVATVLLDHGKRVVGFGKEAVYVVAFDALDLSYLERYALPGF